MPVTTSKKKTCQGCFQSNLGVALETRGTRKRRFNLQPACIPIPPYDIISLSYYYLGDWSSSLLWIFSLSALIKEPSRCYQPPALLHTYLSFPLLSVREKDQSATGIKAPKNKKEVDCSLISTRLAFFGKEQKQGSGKKKKVKKKGAISPIPPPFQSPT